MTTLSTRERATYTIRMVVSHLLYYTGVLHLLCRVVLRNKVVVLMYHRVLTAAQQQETASQPGLVVDEATFARHCRVLARQFDVLTLDQFADQLESRQPFDGPACLITFDDGWIDNLRNALPILRAHGLPAVIFLPVHFIGGQRLFTREALTHLLLRAIDVVRQAPARRDALRELLAPLGLADVLDVGDLSARDAVLRAVRVHRYASGPEFEALVAGLYCELGVNEAALSSLDTFIDWAQVEQMTAHGVTFGGHGADHRVLTQVPADVVRYEVVTSKAVLDDRLPTPVRAFAYPGGGWNEEIARAVEAGGYRLAFTIDPGHVAADDPPFALRRVSIHDGMARSTPMFLARVAGVF